MSLVVLLWARGILGFLIIFRVSKKINKREVAKAFGENWNVLQMNLWGLI